MTMLKIRSLFVANRLLIVRTMSSGAGRRLEGKVAIVTASSDGYVYHVINKHGMFEHSLRLASPTNWW